MATSGETVQVNAVRIQAESFDPRLIEVQPGSAVTWTNDDWRTHTISSAEIESGDIGPGGSFSFVFDRPGHYRYFCMIHPRTVGEVFVR